MNALQKFFIDEWYFAVPMTIMSLVAFALVSWRFLLNRSAQTDMDAFMVDLQDTLKNRGVPSAIKLCQEEPGLIPSVLFVAGLEASEQGTAAMRRSMANAVELEIIPRLHFLLPLILAIGKIATMVGLLGTVISMINTFSAIGDAAAKGGAGGAGVTGHAGAIGLALFATAMGLLTAIPLVFSYQLYRAWIAKFEVKMKASAQKLITLVHNTRS